MTTPDRRFPSWWLSRARQRGAALVVGLLLLLVLTVLAISGMTMATLDLQMAGNHQFEERAFQAAEAGIERAIAAGIFDTNAPTVQASVEVCRRQRRHARVHDHLCRGQRRDPGAARRLQPRHRLRGLPLRDREHRDQPPRRRVGARTGSLHRRSGRRLSRGTMENRMKARRLSSAVLLAATIIAAAASLPALADDTEVFFLNPPAQDNDRPNVLFILDTGESMAEPLGAVGGAREGGRRSARIFRRRELRPRWHGLPGRPTVLRLHRDCSAARAGQLRGVALRDPRELRLRGGPSRPDFGRLCDSCEVDLLRRRRKPGSLETSSSTRRPAGGSSAAPMPVFTPTVPPATPATAVTTTTPVTRSTTPRAGADPHSGPSRWPARRPRAFSPRTVSAIASMSRSGSTTAATIRCRRA